MEKKAVNLTGIRSIHDNPSGRIDHGSLPVTDPWMHHAIQVIEDTYGALVSMEHKKKDLLKFGRNTDVEQDIATLMIMPDGTDNETYVSDNLINTIISTSTGDGEDVKIEGHTISGSNLTFVVQDATLNGQTAVTLTTPLARCTRVYNNDSTELAGTVSVTETDTFTAGVPDTASKVHLQIRAGGQQSEKASTSISSVDYWVVTSFYADMLSKATGAFAEVGLEIRLSGGVFRPVAAISCSDGNRGSFEFKPYLIVPPNADVRLRAISDSATGRDVSGGIEGVLLKGA